MTKTAEELIKEKKKTRIDYKTKMKDVGQEAVWHYEIKKVTFMIQNDDPQKVYEYSVRELTKIRGKPQVERKEYYMYTDRIGYYIIGKNGKWIWGQFNAQMNPGERERLIAKARKEGTYLEETKDEKYIQKEEDKILNEKEKKWLEKSKEK